MKRRYFLKLISATTLSPLAIKGTFGKSPIQPTTCQITKPCYVGDIVIDRENDDIFLWRSDGEQWIPFTHIEYQDKYPNTIESPTERKGRIDEFLKSTSLGEML